MKRVIKPAGAGNIQIEEVPTPQPGPTEVLIRTDSTLISRGSEIWRRYIRPEAIDHQMMGYSLAGTIEAIGPAVTGFSPGDRVAALAPHAQYVVVEVVAPRNKPSVVRLPDPVSFEAGTFWPLATSSVLWMWELQAQDTHTIVFLGQGLVGNGCLQVLKAISGARTVAVDALPLRCELAAKLGAHEIVDASDEDPVEAVKRLTNGQGADAVVEAVGGRAGARAFSQAQDMTRRGGLIQILGLYEDEPLPLDSSKIQGRRIVGGYQDSTIRPTGSDLALDFLAGGRIDVDGMITHRFPFHRADEAFDLLYTRPGDALGVLLLWPEDRY